MNGFAALPDQGQFVSASNDGCLGIWRLDNGELVRTLSGHEGGVTCVIALPEKGVIVSGCDNNEVRVWRIDSGEHMSLNGETPTTCLCALEAASNLIAIGSEERIMLKDVDSGKCVRTLEGHTAKVRALTFLGPALGLLASASGSSTADCSVRLWRVDSGECVRVLEGHTAIVNTLAFLPEAGLLASGSDDMTIKLWRVASGECVRTLRGHKHEVASICYLARLGLIVSGGGDGLVKLWRADTDECVTTLPREADAVVSVFGLGTEEAPIIAVGIGRGEIKLWQ